MIRKKKQKSPPSIGLEFLIKMALPFQLKRGKWYAQKLNDPPTCYFCDYQGSYVVAVRRRAFPIPRTDYVISSDVIGINVPLPKSHSSHQPIPSIKIPLFTAWMVERLFLWKKYRIGMSQTFFLKDSLMILHKRNSLSIDSTMKSLRHTECQDSSYGNGWPTTLNCDIVPKR